MLQKDLSILNLKKIGVGIFYLLQLLTKRFAKNDFKKTLKGNNIVYESFKIIL